MLKRLIEVALPLKEVSEQSAREKSIRHGHISTLHIWWARRPLAACRAVVFASLIPDPDDPECPDDFRTLINEVLGRSEFRPKNSEGSTIEDTPRNRCLEFIKLLVRWENSNNPEYIEPARQLIAAAHKFLHPDSPDDAPKVLDPFAGGGAIPLEALRLGCEAHAIDINPVAHLIQLCTLVYPQKYGRPLPDDAPVPNYIKEAAKQNSDDDDLFGGSTEAAEAEYRRNPLAADVKYWATWMEEMAKSLIGNNYPSTSDGGIPIAYLWARTTTCPNPACRGSIPLVQQLWLEKRKGKKVALRMSTNRESNPPRATFSLSREREIDYDAGKGTLSRTTVACPYCATVFPKTELEKTGNGEGFGDELMGVLAKGKDGSRRYHGPSCDQINVSKGVKVERGVRPDEPLPYLRSIFNCHVYGMKTWGSLYTARQICAVSTFASLVPSAVDKMREHVSEEYATAVGAFLCVLVDRLADFSTTLCAWKESAGHTFARQALGIVWDYAEINPFSGVTGSWKSQLSQVLPAIGFCAATGSMAKVFRGSAEKPPFTSGELTAILTDPPYYDAVPYADLSDFFYVWLKRTLPEPLAYITATPLTPKAGEIVQLSGRNDSYAQKTKEWFEQSMQRAFSAWGDVLHEDAICGVMFAHKTAAAWESLIGGLLQARLSISASWPLHTEMSGRLRALGSAALASSILLVCRKCPKNIPDGLWDDVRKELRTVSGERLDYFWTQGIRGADFFISAIGPALSVFGRYERVVRLSGEEVSVGQFLDEVRDLVTHYALSKIIGSGKVSRIDPESQFYVVWKWSYGEAKVPADEAFKLSQALGFDTEMMWDKTGVLDKSGQNVSALPIAKRMKIKNLGEPAADGIAASLIDVLHRMCAFRDKGDTAGLSQFLGRSGQARNPALWLVAQAVSEILPDGEKEKQLLQGLLNQKEGLEESVRQGELF